MAWLAAGIALLVALCAASVAFGTRRIPLAEVFDAFLGEPRDRAEQITRAVLYRRLPRTVLAALIGAALAVSGTAMQAVTRNPLADPGILGVSNGAALAVVIGLAFFDVGDPSLTMAISIAGSAVAAVFVYTVGSLGRGGATPLKLALAGAASSAAFASLVSAIVLPRARVMETFRSWQIGGVGGASWESIGAVAPVLAAGAFVCLASARGMNSLALGDDVATGLGENVRRTRAVASLGAVVLCGAAVAAAGPIGFVGLVVPHVCRLAAGVDHRWLLPLSALVGACLLVGADLVGRVLVDSEQIDVGIITPFIGAPLFVWIVRRQKVREL